MAPPAPPASPPNRPNGLTVVSVLIGACGLLSFFFPSLSLASKWLYTGASVAGGVLVLAFEPFLRETFEVHGGFVVQHRRISVPIALVALAVCLVFAITTSLRATGTPRTESGSPAHKTTPGSSPIESGRVYIPNGDGNLTVISPSDQMSRISVGMEPQTPTIAPPGTPNQGTLYIPQLAGDATAFMTIIKPGGAQRTITMCQGPGRAIVAPSGTPNAGTVYVPCRLNDGRGYIGIVDTGSHAHFLQIGSGPSGGVAAPSGGINAGTIYVSNTEAGTVSILRPGEKKPITIRVGGQPQAGAVAPTGTPNAGTVYIPNADGVLDVISPSGKLTEIAIGGDSPRIPVIAPSDAPNAGSVYVVQGLSGVVDVIRPSGEVGTIEIDRGQNMYDPAVAPAHTKNAGMIYIPDHGFDAEGYLVHTITPNGSVGQVAVGRVPQTPVIASENAPNAGTVYIACSAQGELRVIRTDGSTVQLDSGNNPGNPAIS